MQAATPRTSIFIAEDNPADVYLVRQALEEHGVTYDLEVAQTGREALSLLRRQHAGYPPDGPGLILLDLNLPQHDGNELLQYIRENAELRAVPVIILTSSDSPADRQTATRLGATRYIRKPSNLEEFLAIGAIFKEVLVNGSRGSGGS